MNGRSLYKRLYRSRAVSIWGRRAQIAVRFPLTYLCGDPPPEVLMGPQPHVVRHPSLYLHQSDGSVIHRLKDVWVCTDTDPQYVSPDVPRFDTVRGDVAITGCIRFDHYDAGEKLLSSREEPPSDELVQFLVEQDRVVSLLETEHESVPECLLALLRSLNYHYATGSQTIFVHSGYVYLRATVKASKRYMKTYSSCLSRALRDCRRAGYPVKLLKHG